MASPGLAVVRSASFAAALMGNPFGADISPWRLESPRFSLLSPTGPLVHGQWSRIICLSTLGLGMAIRLTIYFSFVMPFFFSPIFPRANEVIYPRLITLTICVPRNLEPFLQK